MLFNLINKVKQDRYKFNDSKFRNFVMPAQIINGYCLISISYNKIYMVFNQAGQHINNRTAILDILT
jgi:hypothetical protein